MLWRRPRNAPGSPEEVPASFSALSVEAPGGPRPLFWSCLDSISRFRSINCEMLENVGRYQGSKMEPKRVPGSSHLAVLWMAGCGQQDMGAVEGEMAVPGREEGQTPANEPAVTQRAEGPGGG